MAKNSDNIGGSLTVHWTRWLDNDRMKTNMFYEDQVLLLIKVHHFFLSNNTKRLKAKPREAKVKEFVLKCG